jgi:hypothetical protein
MYCSKKDTVATPSTPAYTYTEQRSNTSDPTGQVTSWQTTGVASIDNWTCRNQDTSKNDIHSGGVPGINGTSLSKWSDLYNGTVPWKG